MSGKAAVELWHELVNTRNAKGVKKLLADDVVFYSPVVHTPQMGKSITNKYLMAAFEVFFNETFRYVREVRGPSDAVLEFELVIDGIAINGVDLISWNEAQQITSFKVMIRPLKGVNLIHQKMGEMLQRLSPPGAS